MVRRRVLIVAVAILLGGGGGLLLSYLIHESTTGQVALARMSPDYPAECMAGAFFLQEEDFGRSPYVGVAEAEKLRVCEEGKPWSARQVFVSDVMAEGYGQDHPKYGRVDARLCAYHGKSLPTEDGSFDNVVAYGELECKTDLFTHEEIGDWKLAGGHAEDFDGKPSETPEGFPDRKPESTTGELPATLPPENTDNGGEESQSSGQPKDEPTDGGKKEGDDPEAPETQNAEAENGKAPDGGAKEDEAKEGGAENDNAGKIEGNGGKDAPRGDDEKGNNGDGEGQDGG